jgi:hypothetical protein
MEVAMSICIALKTIEFFGSIYERGTSFAIRTTLLHLSPEDRGTTLWWVEAPDGKKFSVSPQQGSLSVEIPEERLPAAWFVIDPLKKGREVIVRQVAEPHAERRVVVTNLLRNASGSRETLLTARIFYLEGVVWFPSEEKK